jgi:hypothetical protein
MIQHTQCFCLCFQARVKGPTLLGLLDRCIVHQQASQTIVKASDNVHEKSAEEDAGPI